MAKLTDKKREMFCAALASGYSVTAAAKQIGVSRAALYAMRLSDEEFLLAWDEAVEEGTDVLEDAAIQRATEGSDTLLIFMLKARRPDKFKDRQAIEVSGTVALADRMAAARKRVRGDDGETE